MSSIFSRSRSGFTLIELLIVVAIIAILAAIAVPNFLEAQTRAKVSRNKADMRSIATGLETYRIDNNVYPPMWEAFQSKPGQWYSQPYHARVPSWLTTPVAHLNSIPADPFRRSANLGAFLNNFATRHIYFNMKYQLDNAPTAQNFVRAGKLAGEWLMYSVGPDKDEFNRPGGTGTINSRHVYIDYDASNGTVSVGNVFRTQKSGEALGVDEYYYN